jgi:hypothetical protein
MPVASFYFASQITLWKTFRFTKHILSILSFHFITIYYLTQKVGAPAIADNCLHDFIILSRACCQCLFLLQDSTRFRQIFFITVKIHLIILDKS